VKKKRRRSLQLIDDTQILQKKKILFLNAHNFIILLILPVYTMKLFFSITIISSFVVVNNATPIDSNVYHHVVNEDGDSGPCRGVAASDKVDSRSKGDMTQEQCEVECTNGMNCVGYSYSAGSENGFCIIYGPGQDGTCTSNPEMQTMDHCGSCSVNGKKDKGTCGSCEIPQGSPIYAGGSAYADNSGLCNLQSGVWTEGEWTSGTWEDPTDGWTGDSHITTHVHYVTAVAGYDCYDKDKFDHLPKCTGMITMEGTNETSPCQDRFEGEIEGKDTSGLTEGDCVAGGPSCVFVPAPEAPVSISFVHSPITTTDGWNPHNVPFGDALNDEVPIALGACRAEGTQIEPPTQKDCRWDKCTASTGESVATQDGCKQACLDDPSGTCVSYSHADNSYCVIHGPLVHAYSNHTSEHAESGESWVDTWDSRDRALKFCLGNVANNPPGCKNSDTAKPNPAYMCQTLKTNPDRWMAYGPKGEPKDLHVMIGVLGSSVEELENSKMEIQTRISELAFWHEDLITTDSIKDDGEGGTNINLILQVDSTCAPPMMTLLQRQFDWATAAPTDATESSEATEGGVGYFNAVMADAFPLGAQLDDFEITIANPENDDDEDSVSSNTPDDKASVSSDTPDKEESDNHDGHDHGHDSSKGSTSMSKNLAVGVIVSTLLGSLLVL